MLSPASEQGQIHQQPAQWPRIRIPQSSGPVPTLSRCMGTRNEGQLYRLLMHLALALLSGNVVFSCTISDELVGAYMKASAQQLT